MLASPCPAFFRNTIIVSLGLVMAFELGCAATSYHNRSFTEVLPESRQADLPAGTEAEARFVDDFDDAVLEMYADGYELVGFAKFTSALAPNFALRDARLAAKSRGASIALLRRPQSARLNQSSYVTTFWRPMPKGRFVLGAYYQDLAPQLLGAVGCPNNVVMLRFVVDGTPAAGMGLATDDVIAFVDDVRITDARSLDQALVDKAGREVEIRYVRAGERFVTKGTLAAITQAPAAWPGRDAAGLVLVEGPVEAALAKEVGRTSGVFVDGILYGSPACEAGFRTSDFVVAIGGEPIEDLKGAAKALEEPEGEIEFTVVRGLKRQVVTLIPGEVGPDGPRPRLDLAEASLGMPWAAAEGKNWTWLTATGMAISNAAGQYVQYVENERIRIEEYNRAQARAASLDLSSVKVGSGRRGTSYVTTRSGDVVSVNRDTAIMMRDNPGYYMQSGRRGSWEIYDTRGQRVQMPGTQARNPFEGMKVQPALQFDFGDPLKEYFQNAPTSADYGHEWQDHAQWYSTGGGGSQSDPSLQKEH